MLPDKTRERDTLKKKTKKKTGKHGPDIFFLSPSLSQKLNSLLPFLASCHAVYNYLSLTAATPKQNTVPFFFSYFSKAVFLFLLRCIPLPPFFYLLGLMRIHLVIIRLVSPGRCDFTNDYRSCTSSDWCGFIQQSSFLYLLGLMRIHLAIIVLVTPRIDADSSRDYRSRIFPDGCGFIQRLPLLRIHLSHSSWTIQENPAGARAAGWT